MFPEAMLSICAALNCDGQCFGRRSTIFEGSVVVRGCFIISGQRLIIMGQTEPSNRRSIRLVDWSAYSPSLSFPFQWASTERCGEVACPKTAHTVLTGTVARRSISLRSSTVSILSGGPPASSANSSSWSFLHASETQLSLLKNYPTMTTL